MKRKVNNKNKRRSVAAMKRTPGHSFRTPLPKPKVQKYITRSNSASRGGGKPSVPV